MFSSLHRIQALASCLSLCVAAVLLLSSAAQAQPATLKQDTLQGAATPANMAASSTASLNDGVLKVQQSGEDVMAAPQPGASAQEAAKGQPVDETSRTAWLVLLGIAVAVVIVKRRSNGK